MLSSYVTHTHTHTHIFKGLRTQRCSKLFKKRISLNPKLCQLYSLILTELRRNQCKHKATLVWYHQFQNFSNTSHSGLNIMEGEMSNAYDDVWVQTYNSHSSSIIATHNYSAWGILHHNLSEYACHKLKKFLKDSLVLCINSYSLAKAESAIPAGVSVPLYCFLMTDFLWELLPSTTLCCTCVCVLNSLWTFCTRKL
jgi:hypothetical protein